MIGEALISTTAELQSGKGADLDVIIAGKAARIGVGLGAGAVAAFAAIETGPFAPLIGAGTTAAFDISPAADALENGARAGFARGKDIALNPGERVQNFFDSFTLFLLEQTDRPE